MTLPTKKIGSLINDGEINLISGFAFKSNLFSESKGIPLIRIRDVVRGRSDTFYTGDYDNKYIVKDGDILIGMDGNFNVSKWRGGKALLNQRVCCIRSTGNEVNESFLLYFLPKELKRIEERTSYVTVKHLSTTKIKEILFPVLEEDSQTRIAEILEKADALRQKRKESIKLLDDFLRSTFLDMFGDPVVNPKGWGTKTIEELVTKNKYAIKRGPFGGSLKKEIFVKKGYLVYEQYHALNNDFSFGRYFINEEKYNELKPFEVKKGDIIISCSGVYLGKLAIVPEGSKKGVINQALLKISLDQTKMNNHLFCFIFSNANFKGKYFGNKIGSGIPNFPSMKEFKLFKFIQPPIELQNKFADIVQQVEKLKAKYQESEKELDNLFGSLMQRAFKGEL